MSCLKLTLTRLDWIDSLLPSVSHLTYFADFVTFLPSIASRHWFSAILSWWVCSAIFFYFTWKETAQPTFTDIYCISRRSPPFGPVSFSHCGASRHCILQIYVPQWTHLQSVHNIRMHRTVTLINKSSQRLYMSTKDKWHYPGLASAQISLS